MSAKTSAVIKICSKTTSFIICSDKKIVFWGAVGGGEYHIINDVSQCLQLKFNDAEQLTKAKGVCLCEAIGIKEDRILAEVIGDRVEQLFRVIKEELKIQGLLERISCFFITKDDNYIPDMDILLNKVMGIEAKCIDLSRISVHIKEQPNFVSECYAKFSDEYF